MISKKRPNGYWTKERCTDEALKYRTRSEFKKLSRSAFASAKRNGWLDELCGHMVLMKKANGYWTKERCSEEALKYQTRTEFQKKSNSAYSTANKNGWLDKLCSHMSTRKMLGSYQTKEQCAEAAIKFKSRSEFKRECSAAYNVARKRDWLEDVCAHMNSRGGWDKNRCFEEAIKYQTRTEFNKLCGAAYSAACKNGWLDEVCQHMKIQRKPQGYWTRERCGVEARKYQSRAEFNKLCGGAFKVSREKGWLDEICKHMKVPKKPNDYWTKERCGVEALKYQSRAEFEKLCRGAYRVSKEKGWLGEICKHMKALQKPRGYWTKERCSEEALKYQTRLKFQKSNEAAYTAARKNGWLDSICAHMIEIKKPKGFWTKKRCAKEALKYETRTDFNTGSNGAYKTAVKEGWLDEICTHMLPVGNEYLRGLYLIINKRLNTVYIGLTSNFKRRKEEHLKGSRTNASEIMKEKDTDFIPLTDYVSVEQATILELDFANKYEKEGYRLLNDRSRIGGLGGSRLKWTEELCKVEALKYNTRYEFQKGSRQAHAAAQRQGILENICKHMVTAKREVYWTRERIEAEAIKYKKRSAFAKGSGGAYNAARKNGWLDEICLHMRKLK